MRGCAPVRTLSVLEHGCGQRPAGTAPGERSIDKLARSPRAQKVKAYTTPTTTMFPSVAMMAIQSSNEGRWRTWAAPPAALGR